LLVPTLPTPVLGADGEVTRQAGANRFATAAEISEATFNPGVNAVYIVNGLGFADALAAGPAAAFLNGPVLLVNPNSIPPETSAELTRLNPDEIIIAGGTGVVSAQVQTDLASDYPSATVSRQAGPNRFATAAEISEATFNPGVNAVYVVNGLGFPDALAAGPAAADYNGPVLLVNQNSIPAETSAELTRLNPDEIIIAGGTGVVSPQVQTALTNAYPSATVSRQAGANRFATAAEISEATFSPGVNAAYVANGLMFPDALSAGPAAAQLGGPLLLVNQCSIPTETADELGRLRPDEIIIAGGTGVVCAALESQLQMLLPCVGSPPDTDGDGINDDDDAFACDPTNASGRSIPFRLDFNNGEGGLENAGFTGVMTNSTDNSLSLFNPADVVTGAGPDGEFLRLSNIPEGDALDGTNTLRNGFQVNVTTPLSSFTVHGQLCGAGSYPSQEFASVGVYFGTGDQDNYVKATLKGDPLGHSVHDGREVGGNGAGINTLADPLIPGAACVDLYLAVNSTSLLYTPSYSLNGGTTRKPFGGTGSLRTVPASWINGSGSKPLAVGIWTTSAGPAPAFTADFNFLEVVPGLVLPN
jgi:putative cell wall-binding protein